MSFKCCWTQRCNLVYIWYITGVPEFVNAVKCLIKGFIVFITMPYESTFAGMIQQYDSDWLNSTPILLSPLLSSSLSLCDNLLPQRMTSADLHNRWQPRHESPQCRFSSSSFTCLFTCLRIPVMSIFTLVSLNYVSNVAIKELRKNRDTVL